MALVAEGLTIFRRWSWRTLMVSILMTGCATWCGRNPSSTDDTVLLTFVKQLDLDRAKLNEDLLFMTSEPHVFGSERQSDVAQYIVKRGRDLGFDPKLLSFTADTPNPVLMENPSAPADLLIGKQGQNIYMSLGLVADPSCILILGSHYDTKYVPGTAYVGANDSASSSALLLGLADYLQRNPLPLDLKCDVGLIWFDGEEPILNAWKDGELKHPARIQDNTYGSRHFATQLQACRSGSEYCLPDLLGGQVLESVIIVDMVGSPALKFTNDLMSDAELKEIFLSGLVALGEEHRWTTYAQAVEDDHTPFVKMGIPAMDVIDFHNLQHWHKHGDTMESISMESIVIASKSALFLLLRRALGPQVSP